MSHHSARALAASSLAVLLALGSTLRAQDAAYKKDARPPVDLRKDKTLYVVPYAHLDTQWRWSYPQTIREFLANTLHDNFKLLDKYPNYVYNFSGSRRYEMMHEYFPEDWDRLKAYIKAGRWFPCGSSVDEDDANVPSLESMVRQVLYGNHYFRREFGVASEEFMLPDCFGFPASLPTILVHCGIKGFSTQKLTWGSAIGIPFKIGNWIGPDGSMLPSALDPGGYGGGVKEDLSQSKSWLQRIDNTGAQSGIFADYHYYGTGDRGGAPAEESVAMMEKCVQGTGPLRVISATAEQMFLDLPAAESAKLPSYKGDILLTEHSAGSITSAAYMKRWNRKNELLADAAERSAVAANWLGAAPYPAKKLYDAWDLTLGSQMHDMLPGTSLPKAYEYCWNDDALSANQFAAVEEDSVSAVIAALDTNTPAGGVPLVVYNPLAVAREDVAEGSIAGADGEVQVYGPDGKPVPTQVTRRSDGRIEFLFLANVPPVSFTTFEAKAGPATGKPALGLTAAGRTLENARYKVTVNDAGDVSSIVDKAGHGELLAAPMRLEFHQENPMRFPAWNMDWADRQKPARGYVDGPAAIRVVENGPVRVTLEIERQAEGSRFVSRVSLSAGSAGDAVEFRDQIDWGTREASLKLALPLTVSNPLAAYDDKVGVALRGNNDPKKYEVPQHQWLDLTDRDGSYGVTLLNDCKFGSDKPDDKTLRLTLLYTPGVRSDYQDQATQDFGRHDMAYAVSGHAKGWQEGGAVLKGSRFNQPLRVFPALAAHPGALGRSFSLASLDNPNVEIVAIKKAEDSDETIVRLRESAGQGAQTALLRFAAPIQAAREVDGQERALAKSAEASLRDGQVVVQLPAFGIRAYALKLGALPTRLAPPSGTPLDLPFDQDAVSARTNRADGDFDGKGRTFPAEMLPATIVSEGVPFKVGPTTDGKNNALACRGQSLPLAAGDFDRVAVLAASSNGDKLLDFGFSGGSAASTAMAKIQDWSGYVGQWDNRQWKGKVLELTYAWGNPLDGVLPGFVKPATVAWYSSHLNERGGDGVYEYCYLFKYEFKLPKGARTFVLPNAPDAKVFAVTLVKSGRDATPAAQPLYDTFADHQPTAPSSFQPAQGKHSDTIIATVTPPLYWQGDSMHYTLDGSEPTVSSPKYTGGILLHASATIKAREFLPGAVEGGPVGTAHYEVDDRTPPTLRSAQASTLTPEMSVAFSEAVEPASAGAAGNYHFDPADVTVVSATAEGPNVTLRLSSALADGSSHRLSVTGVRDNSPAHNAAAQATLAVSLNRPAFSLPETVVCDGQQSRDIPVAGLPIQATDPWTINLFVRTHQQPDNRTLIAGFGAAEDSSGQGRYLSKFANGIHFWSGDQDGETTSPLDLDRWQMLTATYDGATVRIYKNAQPIGEGTSTLSKDESIVRIAPVDPWDNERRFKGDVGQLTIWKEALSAEALTLLLKNAPPESN